MLPLAARLRTFCSIVSSFTGKKKKTTNFFSLLFVSVLFLTCPPGVSLVCNDFPPSWALVLKSFHARSRLPAPLTPLLGLRSTGWCMFITNFPEDPHVPAPKLCVSSQHSVTGAPHTFLGESELMF